MEQITTSKKAELVQSAKLPFTEKLALTDASRIVDHLVLSETFDHPVFEIIKLFNQALRESVFDRYALAGGLAAIYPPFVTADGSLMSEPLYVLLVVVAMLLAMRRPSTTSSRTTPRTAWCPAISTG